MADIAREDQAKRKVHVRKSDLIARLIENRKQHALDYEEAVSGYVSLAKKKLNEAKEEALKHLEQKCLSVEKLIDSFSPDNLLRHNRGRVCLIDSFYLDLKVPENYDQAYARAIELFTWSVEETIELSAAEFDCFVRNVWDWTSDFVAVTSIYKSLS